MSEPFRVSSLLLERYHIGEVSPEEKTGLERALAVEPALKEALEGLERSDREILSGYPRERFLLRSRRFRPSRRVSPVLWGLCAAALVSALFLPRLLDRAWFPAPAPGLVEGERPKGEAGDTAELSLYLKGDPVPVPEPVEGIGTEGANAKLPDRAVLREGNTVQLAYRLRGDVSGSRYGVIFSIDGRSALTMHYPYDPGQNTRLVSGRTVFLEEAYTLDDAPNYEVFFFVVDDEPLEPRNILRLAERLVPRAGGEPGTLVKEGAAVFKGCEVKTLVIGKDTRR